MMVIMAKKNLCWKIPSLNHFPKSLQVTKLQNFLKIFLVRLRTFRRFLVILDARRPQRKIESEKPDKYLNLIREIGKYGGSLCDGHYHRVWNSPEKTWKVIVITENPRKNESHPEDTIPEDSVNNEGVVRELLKLAATWSPMEVTKIRLVWKVNTYKMIE